ncbi:MAG: Hsp70 family protein [Myxococcota bacterium]|nr:Hsp70 family protein [Myxococcota bacterium]
MGYWALDLGTTNTGIARWNEDTQRPELVRLTDICRAPDSDEPLEAPRMIPSATEALPHNGFFERFCARPLLASRFFIGRWAHIGRPALEKNEATQKESYAPLFKSYLGKEPLRTLAKLEGRPLSARDITRRFLRELLYSVHQATGERLRELVVTTPVDAYETYRAEVSQIARGLGVKRVRFIDEPVAAALGYGISLGRDRNVLVVDFGGGTLDIALVTLTAKGVRGGQCSVTAKAGRAIGGNVVDGWILDHLSEKQGISLSTDTHDWERGFWLRAALAEARHVKEALFFEETALFRLTPPEHMRRLEAQLSGEKAKPIKWSRQELITLLEQCGMYRELNACVEEVLSAAMESSVSEPDIDEVLMVGGSTLLPGIYARFEERFGRNRVRAFQPFEAVAYGAAAFAAEQIATSDYIIHDYALRTHDARTHQEQYVTIVPRGTRFPTKPDFWRQKLVPTCALGEPERLVKLVICELGIEDGELRRFTWDARGNVKSQGGNRERVVVPLNESNPALGTLNPPHQPGDRTPRLDIQFGVNEERWLVATVIDLQSGQKLMDGEPVIRLL